jgi:hypothetical protein
MRRLLLSALLLTASLGRAEAQSSFHLEPTFGIAKTTPAGEQSSYIEGSTGYRAGLGLRYTRRQVALTTGLFYQSAGYQYLFIHTLAHYVTLPLTVGLQIGVGKHAAIIPSIGVEAVSLEKTKETYSERQPNQPGINLTREGRFFYERSLYGMFQVRFQHALTRNTAFFVSPVVRYGLTSFEASPNRFLFLKQTYFLMLGADAGVSIKL